MSDGVRIDIKINENAIQHKIESLIDEKTMLEVHNKFAQFCDEYVPMQEGVLAQTIQVTPEYVRYTQPYSHYMYVGEIYGPNIPTKDKNGNITGWFSRKGQKKQPTGRQMTFSAEKHQRASKEWDKAMMAERGQDFTEAVKEILVQRARELYG